jgi:hypothetical protein
LVGASDRIGLPGKPFVFTIDTVNISDPKVLAITIVDGKGAPVPFNIVSANTGAGEAGNFLMYFLSNL